MANAILKNDVYIVQGKIFYIFDLEKRLSCSWNYLDDGSSVSQK